MHLKKVEYIKKYPDSEIIAGGGILSILILVYLF